MGNDVHSGCYDADCETNQNKDLHETPNVDPAAHKRILFVLKLLAMLLLFKIDKFLLFNVKLDILA